MARSIRLAAFVISLLMISGIIPASLWSAESTVFERTFVRGKGSPVTESAVFSAPSASGIYRLVIQNGSSDGKSRCSSATVVLNGSPVAGPSEFNQQIARIEKAVSLMAGNRLDATLKSGPGCILAISVTGLDRIPPKISITSPRDGEIISSAETSVVGSVDDPEASVAVNGVQAVNSGGAFQAAIPLSYGPNTIVAEARDFFGNTSASSVKIVMDNIPPVVTLDSIPQITAVRSIEIKGRVDDLTAVTVSIQGRSATIPAGGGTFSFVVDLIEGLNTITVEAIDKVGNKGSDSVTVTLDTIAPGAPVIDPLHEITSLTTIVISGSAEPGSTVMVKDGPSAVADSAGRFSVEIALATDRLNTFTFTAADVTGNEGPSTTVSVTQDSVSPSVTGFSLLADPKVTLMVPVSIRFSEPPDPSTITSSNITVTGPSGPVDGIFSISGSEVVFTPETEFAANRTYTLSVGQDIRDRAGNGLASVFIASFETIRGPAFITGEVYDDTMGQPLSDAVIRLLSVGGTEPATAVYGVSDRMGRFSLSYQGGAGEAAIVITKPGYTKAIRRADLKPNRSVTVFDSRLTPVTSGSLPASGGSIKIGGNSLSFSPSSFGVVTGVSIAVLSQQGLGLKLPNGWSPVYGVDVSYEGAIKSPAALVIKNVWAFTGQEGLMAAYLDEAALSWRAVDLQLEADFISMQIAEPGQYVLLIADTLPTAPPMPQSAGSVILPSSDAVIDTGVATIVVGPSAALSSPDARGIARLTFKTASPMPSGTTLDVRISETYEIATGEKIETTPFNEDIVLYSWPPEGDENSLSASFTVTPSRYYPLGTLIYGRVNIDAFIPSYDAPLADDVIGDAGGEIMGTEGQGIYVLSSSLTGDTVFKVGPLSEADLPGVSGYPLSFIGGLTLDMQGGQFRQGMYPQFILPGLTLPEGTRVIVARVEAIGGSAALRAVATARIVAGRVVVEACLMDTCIQSGRYAFYVPSTPFGFIDAAVYKDGLPYKGAVATVSGLPFKSLSGIDGRCRMVGLAGGIRVTAVDAALGLSAAASGMLSEGQTVSVTLDLSAVRPTVTGISPTDKASGVDAASRVTVTFSASVDPKTVNTNSFAIYEAGFPNTRTPVSGRISLSSKNIVATFIPDKELKPETTYHVKLTADIKDTIGSSLIPFESVFTTATDLSNDALPPGALKASMPDADGYVIVRGGRGLAAPGSPVVVINKTKNIVLTVIAENDGSFEGKIRADITDELVVQVMDLLGNISNLSTGLFQNDDGTAAVGPKGGTIYGPGGIKAMVPVGAFDETVVLKVTMGTEEEIKDVKIDTEMKPVGVFHIDSGGIVSKKEIKVAFPAPDWITPEHQVLIGKVINFRGIDELELACPAVLDEGGEQTGGERSRTIKSTSPPFAGIVGGLSSYVAATWPDLNKGVGYAMVRIWSPYDSVFVMGAYSFVLPALTTQLVSFPITIPINLTFNAVLSNIGGAQISQISIQGPPAKGQFVPQTLVFNNDPVPPTVFTSSIPDGATGVLLGQNITIEMSEEVDANTVNCDPSVPLNCAGTVVVKDSSGNIVEGEVYLAADGKTIVFVPKYGYKYDTVYTIEIDGVEDLGGNTLSGYTSTFRTFEPTSLATVPGVSNTYALDRYTSSIDGKEYLLVTGAYTDSSGNVVEDSGLVVVDIMDPEHPVEVGVAHTLGFDRDVKALPGVTFTDHFGNTKTGDFAVVVGGMASALGYLNLMDVTDPKNPYRYEYLYLSWNPMYSEFPPAGVPDAGGSPYRVELLGTYAYVANLGLGLQAVDLTTVTSPQSLAQREAIVGTITEPSYRGVSSIKKADPSKSFLLATKNKTLSIIDPGLNVLGEVAGLNLPFDVTGVSDFPVDVDGDGNLGDAEDNDSDAKKSADETFDLAFVSTASGVAIIDVTTPSAPCMMDLIRTGGLPGKVIVNRERRLAYAMRGGLITISLKDLKPSSNCSAFPPLVDANHDGIDDRILGSDPNYPGWGLVLNDDGSVGYLISAAGVETIDLGKKQESPIPPIIVNRTYYLSQFDSPVPGPLSSQYIDTFKMVDLVVENKSDVTVKIFDVSYNEKGTLVPKTTLNPGQYKFVVDYQALASAGLDPYLSPEFYIQARMSNVSGVTKVIYPGRMNERTEGKMLGQTIVHDVLIQDGSLNLSRQDLELKGRGPQLSFVRSYNNQASGHGTQPLGGGWSHSLDMKLTPVSSIEYGAGSIPSWVTSVRGTFFDPSAVPSTPLRWTSVMVNGTVFNETGGIWYPERGRHGTLEVINSNFIYTSKDGTRYKYPYPVLDRATKVRTIEDRNGNTMVFNYTPVVSYTSDEVLESVTDAVGRKLLFEYAQGKNAVYGDDGMRLKKVKGPDNIELNFAYDGNGYLISAERGARRETYDYIKEPGSGFMEYNLAKATDSNGHRYSYEYYPLGSFSPSTRNFVRALKSEDVIKTVTYPDGTAASFVYDIMSGNKRTVTDLRGNDTVYSLNYYGNPLKIEEPLGKITEMTWSIDQGRNDNVMTSKKDANGNTTSYEYDVRGNITKETDPNKNAITSTWDITYNLPLTRTDRNNVTQVWTYDAKGNLKKYTDGDGKDTSYTYNATGERDSMTDPRSYVTTYTYDQWGNPDMVTGPEGSVTDSDHDIRGRLISTLDPNGNKTLRTYDALDHPLTVTFEPIISYTLPSGSRNVHSYTYDSAGNLLSETNRNGLTLTYDYTARNQVKSVSRSAGGLKTYDYDPNGNLISEADWNGVATTHDYDALNRRITTTNRLGHSMSMRYDLNGNLVESKDYEDKATTFAYDTLNRLTDTWQPALAGQMQGNIHNTYFNEADPKTNLKTVTDQEGNSTAYEYNGRRLRTKQTNALGDVHLWEYDDSGNLLKETDEEGKITEFNYDKQNRKTLMTRMGGIKTGYQYDANGNVTHVIDPLLRDFETKYDEWNRAWQVIDPDSYVTTTEYDGEGNKVKTVDGNGNARRWVRDPRGLVQSATDAEGRVTAYTYDNNGNVLTATDPKGTVTKSVYDAEDRLVTSTEAFGQPETRTKTFVSRDKMGNPLEVRDYNGSVTTTVYNSLYLPYTVTDPPASTGRQAGVTETSYYKTGKVKSVTNRRGYLTAYEYDGLGRQTKITDARNQTIESTYDKVGNVKTVKDKRGITKENIYDDLYRLTETKRAGLRLVTNVYDDAGNVVSITDANSNITGLDYNRRNLLVTTTHPDSTTETRTYDGVGNLLTLTNEENKVTTYTYDRENRQTSVEFAGETTVKAYDELGELISVTKPLGNLRTMEYDRLKRLTKVVDDPALVNPGGLDLTTRYVYDANGNLTDQYDARGNHVEMKYDNLNRKTDHIQHKGTGPLTAQYTYDLEGSMTGMTDAKGQVFTYVYDALNRQMDADYPNVATAFNSIVRIHKDYDENNNVTKVTETKQDHSGAVVTDITDNTYDNFDRLLSSTERGLAVTYTYDNNGNRTSVSTPSGATTYIFNNRNWIESATDNSQLSTTYTYYPDGKKKTVTYPNNASVGYAYHPDNRVKGVTNKVGSAVISSYDYLYDGNGNRTSQTEYQNGVTETTDYTYDNADRMKDFTVSGSGTTKTEYTFEGYNRKTEKVTTNGVVVKDQTYTYDETDWLTQIADSRNNKAIDYTFDLNGNIIRKADNSLPNGDMFYAYDSRNKMVEAKRGPPGSQVVLGLYDYNAEGFRVRHRLSERGDLDYYYDGSAVIEERNATNNTLLAHYRYGDRLIALSTASNTQYYHYDALGSTVNLTNAMGATEVGYQLDPWGHIRLKLGESLNRHIFTGQEHDENTGLIYFGARYYDPDTARFMTQDTYLGEAGTPPSLNRYLYAYSNPTVYVDLLGYYSWDEFKSDVRTFNALTNPLEMTRQIASAGLEYAGRKIEEYAENNVPGTWGVMGLTAAKTVNTLAKGVVDMPDQIADETVEFAKDRKLENLPILGGVGKALGETSYNCYNNPGLVSCSQFAGALGSAILTVEGGASIPKGIRSLKGTASEEAAALTTESRAGQLAETVKPIEKPNIAQRAVQKIEEIYRESYAGNEVGAIDFDIKSFRWRDESTGRFTTAPEGARFAPVEYTEVGERFVRLASHPKNLKWTFEHPGGAAPETFAVPEDVFNAIGRDPVKLKDMLDLPGDAPTLFRILEPPKNTKIQRGAVPGREFGGRGKAPEVLFPEGF